MPKLLQFDVKTSCRQDNDLFEVMEFDFLAAIAIFVQCIVTVAP